MTTAGFSKARRTAAALLLLAIAATAWWMLHRALRDVGAGARGNVALNPAFEHCERLKVAAARASMDALGMQSATGDAYRNDYRLQRTQMQADLGGLEKWAADDTRRQGLLLEIRASMANLLVALDGASSAAPTTVPMLPALNRAESAFSNYSASLTEPAPLRTTNFLLASPVVLWWVLVLLLIEVAALAWVVLWD